MQVDSEVYLAIIAYCEELERRGVYQGNGHHLAQKLSALVAERPTLGVVRPSPYKPGVSQACTCTSKSVCWNCMHTMEGLRNAEREEKERYISYTRRLHEHLIAEGNARIETAKFVVEQIELLPNLRRDHDEVTSELSSE